MSRATETTPCNEQSLYEWLIGVIRNFLKQVAAIQSTFLYIRLFFWSCTIIISFSPFLFVETKEGSDLNINFNHFYHAHYQGILEVFVVTIATSMFDVMAMTILLASQDSIIAICSTVIFGALTILLIFVGFSLGYSIMTPSAAQLHWAFLNISAVLCLVATAFVAVLSNEYKPKKKNSKR